MKKPWKTCDSQGFESKKMEAAGIENHSISQCFRCVFTGGRKNRRTVSNSVVGVILIFLASCG
jgi:hypothetical protein